jgi:hypothetical protein
VGSLREHAPGGLSADPPRRGAAPLRRAGAQQRQRERLRARAGGGGGAAVARDRVGIGARRGGGERVGGDGVREGGGLRAGQLRRRRPALPQPRPQQVPQRLRAGVRAAAAPAPPRVPGRFCEPLCAPASPPLPQCCHRRRRRPIPLDSPPPRRSRRVAHLRPDVSAAALAAQVADGYSYDDVHFNMSEMAPEKEPYAATWTPFMYGPGRPDQAGVGWAEDDRFFAVAGGRAGAERAARHALRSQARLAQLAAEDEEAVGGPEDAAASYEAASAGGDGDAASSPPLRPQDVAPLAEDGNWHDPLVALLDGPEPDGGGRLGALGVNTDSGWMPYTKEQVPAARPLHKPVVHRARETVPMWMPFDRHDLIPETRSSSDPILVRLVRLRPRMAPRSSCRLSGPPLLSAHRTLSLPHPPVVALWSPPPARSGWAVCSWERGRVSVTRARAARRRRDAAYWV